MNDQPAQPDADESTEPYEPVVMQWRRDFPSWVKRKLAPERSSRRRWWWDRLFVQIGDWNPYAKKDDVLAALKAQQRGRSADVLAEAREIFRRPFETSEGVERRASTLQGAIAIAASFVLAAGGLLLDTSKIRTESWRIAFATVFAFVIMCLVFSALRSLRATSRVLIWHYPDEDDLLLRRTGNDDSEHELRIAADLLNSAGANTNNANYKVAQMRAAGHWLALALVGLLTIALLLLAYTAAGSVGRQHHGSDQSRAGPHRELVAPTGALRSVAATGWPLTSTAICRHTEASRAS